MEAAAIILSGGKSSRMGTNKALLTINEKTNIERIRDRLQPHFAKMILVTNDQDEYRFLEMNQTSDQYPGLGPLAGVHAGLLASDQAINVIVACDMPFVSAELAQALVDQCGEYDAVVPVIYGKQQPLFAVFQKRVAPNIEECLIKGDLRMRHLFDRLHVRYVTEQDLAGFADLGQIFFNMNHPNEYEEALKWVEEGKS